MDITEPLLLSLKVATWATLLATVAAVGCAFALARWRSPLSDFVDAILTLTIVLPPTVIGDLLLVLFGRQGPFGASLASLGVELVFPWQGAGVAARIVAVPLVLDGSRAAFEERDRPMQDGARVLGIRPMRICLRLPLPLPARGVSA